METYDLQTEDPFKLTATGSQVVGLSELVFLTVNSFFNKTSAVVSGKRVGFSLYRDSTKGSVPVGHYIEHCPLINL